MDAIGGIQQKMVGARNAGATVFLTPASNCADTKGAVPAGLRLVKVTVHFDDPGTYHLYYGDGMGHPGTILTFFPWPGALPGRRGTGQLTSIAFSIPQLAGYIKDLTGSLDNAFYLSGGLLLAAVCLSRLLRRPLTPGERPKQAG